MGKKRRPPLRLLEDVVEPKAKEVKTSLCSYNFIILAIKTLFLVLFYYTFSIGLTFYNQRFIHVSLDNFNMDKICIILGPS